MPCEGCLGVWVFPAENEMYARVAKLKEDEVLAAVEEKLKDGR